MDQQRLRDSDALRLMADVEAVIMEYQFPGVELTDLWLTVQNFATVRQQQLKRSSL